MKTILSRAIFGLVSLAPAIASAHPGDHATMSVAGVAHHIVTSPDHLAEVVMGALMVVGLVIRQRRRAAR